MSKQQKFFFVAVFAVLGLIALQIPVAKLAGSKTAFTLFDMFGPIAGGFLGSALGIIAVALMQVANFLLHGAQAVDAGTFIRMVPMLFATLYFAKRRTINWIIPILAIISFLSDPIGRSAWYYSLFWLIPMICYFFQERSLIARSLGATFMAHAVGGAIWIHTFHLSKAVWTGLIPVVIAERLLFAAGIAVMYVLFNNVLALVARKVPRVAPLVNPHYTFISPSNSLL